MGSNKQEREKGLRWRNKVWFFAVTVLPRSREELKNMMRVTEKALIQKFFFTYLWIGSCNAIIISKNDTC